MRNPFSTPPFDRETRHTLVYSSFDDPVFLAGRRVHVLGIGMGCAELSFPLHYISEREGYAYDQQERYQADWEIVQEVLSTTRTFLPEQVERLGPRAWLTQLGVCPVCERIHLITPFCKE